MSDTTQSLTFGMYQAAAAQFAAYPEEAKVVYPVIGLGNEVGEVLGVFKKHIRDNTTPEESLRRMVGELGDVLWYLSQICSDLEVPLEDVAAYNLAKLGGRQARGTIKGEGDER